MTLLQTTIAGSLPKPAWLAPPKTLWAPWLLEGDMLAEGKLVTYGIRFESGSDVVLPDSAPVLRQVAAYMKANAAVKLQITGHTDNVGSPESNLDLSQRRAASVAKVLSDQFEIAAERFATAGKGDTEGLADNAEAEGRAMNRRVEFSKL